MSSFWREKIGDMGISTLIFFPVLITMGVAAAIGLIILSLEDSARDSVRSIVGEEKAQAPLLSLRLDTVNDNVRATIVEDPSRIIEGKEMIVTVFAKGGKKFLCLERLRPKGKSEERIILEIK